MPETERLQELKRQRSLVQEQLAWLDREIAALNVSAPSGSIVSAQATAILARENLLKKSALAPVPVVDLAATGRDGDVLLTQLMAQEKSRGEFSKQGCWAVFLGVMITVGLIIAAIGYFFYR